jgi:glycosyltransferase involved in cell wall biosynthesis
VEKEDGVNLVSISFLLPYHGVDHAGGDLLLQHYRVLAERCARVDAFATEIGNNVVAASREKDIDFDSYTVAIAKFPRWRRTLLGKVMARIWFLVLPVLPDIGACASFAISRSLRERLREADIVELQWFEYFIFARLVKRVNPGAEIIGFIHDIPSQRIERSLSGWPAFLRRAYLAYVETLERQMLRGMRKVIVLSTKDAALLAQLSTSTQVFVLDPPLNLGRLSDSDNAGVKMDSRNGESDISFGFVGAFHRPENNDAGLWLLTDIWPYVLERCPAARLYLVGSKPSKRLQVAASRFGHSVAVTGYVDDIDSYYDLFGTVVIPLRYGAGVKFKTISAILAGKNIVATPIAIEGTLPEDYFFSVSDSAETLAKAMVELATRSNVGRKIAEEARNVVGSRYSLDNYARAVSDVYHL